MLKIFKKEKKEVPDFVMPENCKCIEPAFDTNKCGKIIQVISNGEAVQKNSHNHLSTV